MVVDVTAVGRDLPSAETDTTNRRLVFEGPCDLVHGVDRLLYQAVAAGPHEVVPIANLPFHVTHSRGPSTLRRHRLYRIGVISPVVRDDVSESAVVKLLEGRLDKVAVSPAEA